MKKKIIKWVLIILTIGLILGSSIMLYLFNKPHRDIQAISADYEMEASQLVNEYLADSQLSNEKYLDEEGESKIIKVTGPISETSIDMNSKKVILLKKGGDNAGVSCTLLATTKADALKIGDIVTVKGVIRSGAGYDEDLELYEDVIMEKCNLIN